MRNFDTKKEKILDAALRLIVRHGSSDITIREVAAEAGVNIAAINYYFSSKKQMLAETEKLFRDNFDEAFLLLDASDACGEEKLLTWMNGALAYAVHYPGIFNLLREKLVLGIDKPENAAMAQQLLFRVGQVRELFNGVVGLPADNDEQFSMFVAIIVWQFITSPLLFGFDEKLKDPVTRGQYFKKIIGFFKSKNN